MNTSKNLYCFSTSTAVAYCHTINMGGIETIRELHTLTVIGHIAAPYKTHTTIFLYSVDHLTAGLDTS